MKKICLSLSLLVLSSSFFSQYNKHAGKNRIQTESVSYQPMVDNQGAELKDEDGNVKMKKVVTYEDVKTDEYGNATGNQYDLAVDGAFEGNTIAVLFLCRDANANFDAPKKALKEKGFSVFQWINQPPSAKELKEKLKMASQLWVISGSSQTLTDEHAEVIKDFFESGKGLYIFGDNDPYYADANILTRKIFGTTMSGNTHGAQVVSLSGDSTGSKTGIIKGHLISTGIVNMYEGITIATIEPTQELSPLIYGSAQNLVAAVYEKDGKRAIIDGGFTRLYYAWESAGTDRYIKNAASWLVNYEKFGDEVYKKDEEETDTED